MYGAQFRVPPAPRNVIHAVLWQFPVVCFTLTLLTDIAYWQSSNLMWQNFSSWLLFAGLVVGAFAVLAGIIGYFMSSPGVTGSAFWVCAVGHAIILLLALANSLVHAADGWTAVVPNGLVLSTLTVLVILVAGWLGRNFQQNYRAGATSHG